MLQLVQASSTIFDGNMSFMHGESTQVLANRTAFLHSHGLKIDGCVAAVLEHGTNVTVVTKKDAGLGIVELDSGLKCDALLTQESNLALFLLTADCLPITFYDPHNQAIALAHVSRANTQLRFVEVIVKAMTTQFGSNPKELHVWIGPGIRYHTYVVDLVELNIDQLQQSGVLKQNINSNAADTFTSTDYFSHRRSATTGETEGRFATIAFLKR